MEIVAVLDFETTGLSPLQGDRATEVAAVILKDGQVIDRYQSLMNTGVRIPSFIEALTGITNEMVREAPPAAEVMRAVSDFVGDYPLVAHNASFDCKFWDAELARIQRSRRQEFVCSLLLSRRILPRRQATGSAPSWNTRTCPWPDAFTGRWPTPKWRPPCCSGSKTNCATDTRSRRSRWICFGASSEPEEQAGQLHCRGAIDLTRLPSRRAEFPEENPRCRRQAALACPPTSPCPEASRHALMLDSGFHEARAHAGKAVPLVEGDRDDLGIEHDGGHPALSASSISASNTHEPRPSLRRALATAIRPI